MKTKKLQQQAHLGPPVERIEQNGTYSSVVYFFRLPNPPQKKKRYKGTTGLGLGGVWPGANSRNKSTKVAFLFADGSAMYGFVSD